MGRLSVSHKYPGDFFTIWYRSVFSVTVSYAVIKMQLWLNFLTVSLGYPEMKVHVAKFILLYSITVCVKIISFSLRMYGQISMNFSDHLLNIPYIVKTNKSPNYMVQNKHIISVDVNSFIFYFIHQEEETWYPMECLLRKNWYHWKHEIATYAPSI